MNKRGPKSAAELAIVPTIKPAASRLAPPKHLSPGARTVWLEITASRPPEFFDAGAVPLLETLCTATSEHRRLSAWLERITDLDELAKVTRLLDAHALRIGSAATKLRLSNQAKYDAQRASSMAKTGASYADRIKANYLRDSHED